jgi:Uma2 family endonuclease
MTTLASSLMTAEEFLYSEHGGFELVDGQPVENPMSDLTSWLGGELFRKMSNFAVDERRGRVYPQETGIQVWDDDPNRVRKPDVMFISAARLAPLGAGWGKVVPDLVVEIVSPGDRAERVQRKVADYRAAGVPLIWVLYPEARIAYVYRRGSAVREVSAEESLDGEDTLPGFSLPLGAFFDSAQSAGEA